MKIWFNKVHDSRRQQIETDETEISIGRDRSNVLTLQSPLVSKRQAVIRSDEGKLQFENVGINSWRH